MAACNSDVNIQHSTIAQRRPDDEQWSPKMGMQPWPRKRYLCFYSGFGSPLTRSQMRSQLTPSSSRIAFAASIAHSFVFSHCSSLSFSLAVFSIICLFSSHQCSKTQLCLWWHQWRQLPFNSSKTNTCVLCKNWCNNNNNVSKEVYICLQYKQIEQIRQAIIFLLIFQQTRN